MQCLLNVLYVCKLPFVSKKQFAIIDQGFRFLHIFRNSKDEVKVLTSLGDL